MTFTSPFSGFNAADRCISISHSVDSPLKSTTVLYVDFLKFPCNKIPLKLRIIAITAIKWFNHIIQYSIVYECNIVAVYNQIQNWKFKNANRKDLPFSLKCWTDFSRGLLSFKPITLYLSQWNVAAKCTHSSPFVVHWGMECMQWSRQQRFVYLWALSLSNTVSKTIHTLMKVYHSME